MKEVIWRSQDNQMHSRKIKLKAYLQSISYLPYLAARTSSTTFHVTGLDEVVKTSVSDEISQR